MLVVQTFTGDTLKFALYATIGWGERTSLSVAINQLSAGLCVCENDFVISQLCTLAARLRLNQPHPPTPTITGGPAVFVISWTICKLFVADEANVAMVRELCAPESLPIPFELNQWERLLAQQQLDIECSWMVETSTDWIFQGPSCAVLIINLIFLLRIMWVRFRTRVLSEIVSLHAGTLNTTAGLLRSLRAPN